MSPLQPVILTTPAIQLLVNDLNLSMDCIPDGNGFSYVWEKRNDDFSSRVEGIHLSQLNIYNVTPEDAGDYRCVMRNSTGVIRSNYTTITVEGNQFCLIYRTVFSIHFIDSDAA